MDEIINLRALSTGGVNQLDLISTLISFFFCLSMGFVIRAFYIRRSFSLTGKNHIGSVLPILSAVVFMVIIVIKSSLALSLGLVGALSIVRFRTPIKEPEELVYLFLAIATGLGYGAGHVLITTILIAIILGVIFLWLSNRHTTKTGEYNLVINWTETNLTFSDIEEEVGQIAEGIKLVRLDRSAKMNTAVLLITPGNQSDFDSFTNKLQNRDPDVSCTFFEAKTNW